MTRKERRTNWQSHLVNPVIMLALQYLVQHFVFGDSGYFGVDTGFFIRCFAPGLVFGLLNVFFCKRRREWSFWPETIAFWCIYLLVLAISTALFFGCVRFHVEPNSFFGQLWYWFPQMLYVSCVAPNVLVSSAIGYLFWRNRKLST